MLKRRVFDFFMKGLLTLFPINKGGKLICNILEKVQPTRTVSKNGFKYTFATPNALTLSRAQTLFTKEPETIDWIDSFNDNDVFFDIGANVGVYTIYAGVTKKNLRIFAFEPAFFNYWLLNKNIMLNGLENRVCALSCAMADKNSLDFLYMPHVQDGTALVNFGSNEDYKKERFEVKFKQASVAYPLDCFIESFKTPFPNHIKIDVDGLEKEIVSGATKTLKDPRLKSLAIELNDKLDEDMKLIAVLKDCGLNFKSKKHAPMFDYSPFKDIFNYVFVRK